MLLWIARSGLLVLFVLHIVLAVRLKLRSVAARPVAYQYRRDVRSTTAGRTMIWTGIIIGLFTLFHLAHFTFGWVKEVETPSGEFRNYLELTDEKGRHDVYAMVVAGFTEPWLAVLYIVAQLALFVHLMHGVQSSFQTLGLKNRRFGLRDLVAGIPDRDSGPGGKPVDRRGRLDRMGAAGNVKLAKCGFAHSDPRMELLGEALGDPASAHKTRHN